MALQLYMLGLTVKDMSKSLEFYRRLGVDFSGEDDTRPHIEVKMAGEYTLFVDTKGIKSDNPQLVDTEHGIYTHLLEFYVESQATVDAKYAELTGFGYQSYHTPYVTPFGMYFAMVNDPDGNTILISADAEERDSGSTQ